MSPKNGNAIVPAESRQNTLKRLFEQSKGSIAAVLPKHLTADKILKITLSATSRTPQLLECTPQSILLAVIQAAQLGLEPNTPLGLSYLVPYRGKSGAMEAQFIPGYRGLIRLAFQSGEVRSIAARSVRARDHFEIEYGLDERLVHKPWRPPVPQGDESPTQSQEGAAPAETSPVSDDNPIIAVYAVAEHKEGGKQFVVMWRNEVDAIRRRSRASSSGPWVTDYEQMALKTVLRRLCKTLPLSVELAEASAAEDRAESGETDYSGLAGVLADGEVPQLGAPQRVSATDSLKSKLREQVPASTNGAAVEGDAEEAREPGQEG